MANLMQSGALIDAILVLVVLEIVVFAVLARFVAHAPPLFSLHPAVLWPTLLSGLLLMLAVRFALTDASWTWVAGVLTLAGVTHVADLALRFRAPR